MEDNKEPTRVGPLTTIGELAAELAKLYRRATRGDVPVADASKLATILAIARQCLESSSVEQRMADLEAQLQPRPNHLKLVR